MKVLDIAVKDLFYVKGVRTTAGSKVMSDFVPSQDATVVERLKSAGAIVLADRYAFTAYARDVARGVDPEWIRNLYSFAAQPDIVLYFRVPLDVAVERIATPEGRLEWTTTVQPFGVTLLEISPVGR